MLPEFSLITTFFSSLLYKFGFGKKPEEKLSDREREIMEIQNKIKENFKDLTNFIPAIEKEPTATDFYKRQVGNFWHFDEIFFGKDVSDYNNLPPEQKDMIDIILAFFTIADGIVIQNIDTRFGADCENDEQRKNFRIQATMEDIHAQTYSNAALAFKGSPLAVKRLVDKYVDSKHITEKIGFMLDWRYNSKEKYLRYTAFACAERIFFCTLFAVIFWFRSQNKLAKFIQANELISRDENMHGEWGAYLIKCELAKMSAEEREIAIEKIIQVVKEACEIERNFSDLLIPQDIEDLTADKLKQYAEFIADGLLAMIDIPPIFETENPCPWMPAINHEQKTNHFDNRPSSYSIGSVSDINSLDDGIDQIKDYDISDF